MSALIVAYTAIRANSFLFLLYIFILKIILIFIIHYSYIDQEP